MNSHRLFFRFQIALKAYLWGLVNILILVFTGKLIQYLRSEIIMSKNLRRYLGNKILLISGGPSLRDNFHIVNNYDFIALNSYQSLKELEVDQKKIILSKCIIYYQAPFHKPLDWKLFLKNVSLTIESLPPSAIKVTPIGSMNESNIKHIPKSYLHWYGFTTFRQTGFLTLLSILCKAGFQHIDLLGVDLSYSARDLMKDNIDKKPLSELLSTESEVFYEIERLLDRFSKCEVIITNLNAHSLVQKF